MMEVMLENIVSNAIKYSPEEGLVEIETRQRGETVELRVTDHGIGMSQEQMGRIFDRFYRVEESRNSEVPGYGLGLAIVKSLADLQHVNLSVDSARGVGTTMTLRFPLA